MSQNDFTIGNQAFPAFRADLNTALQALATNNSGATAPSTTFANMWWYDSANNILYIRNEDNDAWIIFAELDLTNDKFILRGSLQLDDGSSVAPALRFKLDTNMGLYRGGTDILKFVTAGTDAVTINASQQVGIGTTPAEPLDINVSATGGLKIGATATSGARITTYQGTTNSYVRSLEIEAQQFIVSTGSPTGTTVSQAMTIDSSGKLGIGTSSPSTLAHVYSPSQDGGKLLIESGTLVANNRATLFMASRNVNNQQGNVSIECNHPNNQQSDMVFRTGATDSTSFGTERMRITSAGNVGIGTSSPSTSLHVKASTNTTLTIEGDTGAGSSFINFASSSLTKSQVSGFKSGASGGALSLSTNNSGGTLIERMRIDSLGTTSFHGIAGRATGSTGHMSISSQANNRSYVEMATTSTSSMNLVVFLNPNGGVGTISTSGSATTYSTSSDYRLKENVVTDWDATTRLKQLKPSRFNFIADADTTVDGFLAHEVQEIVPEAITGTKDAVEVWEDGEELPDGVSVGDNKLDDDGNTIPDYQGIDQSKLVPLLVKTIQELEARITALENGA